MKKILFIPIIAIIMSMGSCDKEDDPYNPADFGKGDSIFFQLSCDITNTVTEDYAIDLYAIRLVIRDGAISGDDEYIDFVPGEAKTFGGEVAKRYIGKNAVIRPMLRIHRVFPFMTTDFPVSYSTDSVCVRIGANKHYLYGFKATFTPLW